MEDNEPLSNKAIVVATSPIPNLGEYIVSASSLGAQDDSLMIRLYTFSNRSSKDPIKLITEVPITMKFSSIAWTRLGEGTEQNPLGFCIGGHSNGAITLWNITTLLNGANQKQKQNYSCVFNQKILNSQVNVLACNEKPHLFAAGTQEISILRIENMTVSVAVQCRPPEEGGDFCSLSWNEKVHHILATSTTTGYTHIYDMKKMEIYLTIYDQSLIGEEEQIRENPVDTSVLWYNDGAQIVISYDDPEYNYLTQYHVSQSKAPNAMYQNGHTRSIIDMVKNTHDNNFLLTLGRDNLVTCWSMRTKKPLVRIQLKEKCSQVAWISKIPDCFITVGFNGELYYYRINFSEDYTLFTDGQEILPKWMNKPCGISFAFGGKLYEFNQAKENTITVYKPNKNKSFVDLIKNFITKIEMTDISEALDEKINESDSKSNMSLFWNALKSMYTKNLDGLFRQMGFDRNLYNKDINKTMGKSKKNRIICEPKFEETEDVSKLFDKPSSNLKESTDKNDKQDMSQSEKPNTIQESISRNINWNVGHEKLIKQSLQFGELDSAVELLFKNNRSSEALIIASQNPELFKKATNIYLNNNKDLFVKSIFPAIINNNFDLLFEYNVVKEWKEYLLYSKTYLGNTEDFVSFAEKLGDKLSTNPDIYASLVCYILAEKYNKSIDLLINNYHKEIEKSGRDEKKQALHNLFEQVISLIKILNDDLSIKNENYNSVIYDYCQLLIEEGLIMEASRYLINIRDNSNLKIVELYDRLYYHCEHELGKKYSKPINPYNIVVIKHKMESAKPGNNCPSKKGLFAPNPFDNPTSSIPQKNFKPFNPLTNPMKETAFGNLRKNQDTQPISQPEFEQKREFEKQESMPQKPFHKTIKPPMIKPPYAHISSVNPLNNPPTEQLINQFRPPKFHEQNKNQLTKPTSIQQISQKTNINANSDIQSEMKEDEKILYAFFEKMQETYNSVYPDENKQKDFGNKISVLLSKLMNHELKRNLQKGLLEFIKLYEQGTDALTLQKLYFKIQSNDWDKNKSWMPLLDRIINMKK